MAGRTRKRAQYFNTKTNKAIGIDFCLLCQKKYKRTAWAILKEMIIKTVEREKEYIEKIKNDNKNWEDELFVRESKPRNVDPTKKTIDGRGSNTIKPKDGENRKEHTTTNTDPPKFLW